MKVEPKITDLRHSHVQHGLERLAKFGILAGFWNRMRFDDEYALRVAAAVGELNKEEPGKRFEGKTDRILTRLELNRLLLENDVRTFRDADIQKLIPGTSGVDQPELIGTPTDHEWFVVDPGYSMDEEAARIELTRRGLVPADTEDGMVFMLLHHAETRGSGIIVLDSWRVEPLGGKEFLHLAYTGGGKPGLFMTSLQRPHSGNYRYLAKKEVVEEKDDDAED